MWAKTVSPDQQNQVGSVQQEQDRAKNGPAAVHHTRSELEEMLRDRFGRTGTGRPGTFGTTAAPFQTDRRTFPGAESECRDPSCRRPQIDPATPMQISRRSRWRAGCLTGPSTRRSMSSGRRGMQTEAAEAGCSVPSGTLNPTIPFICTAMALCFTVGDCHPGHLDLILAQAYMIHW